MLTTKLEYANFGKVEKVLYMQGPTNVIYSYEFEYNTDGRIAKRTTYALTSTVPKGYNVYVYDGAGRLTTDSQFVRTGNGTFKPSRVAKFQYTYDNIMVAEDYDLSTGTADLDTRLKYEYDISTSPFRNLEYEYYIKESGSAIYTVTRLSPNNVLKVYRADGNGGWDIQYTVDYQYNSNNYARKATRVNASPNERTVNEYSFQ